jgi:two-component system cell cycle sensor histidine kinase/response regulator CckA
MTPDPKRAGPRPRTILVVDDDRMMRVLIERTLQAEGYEVLSALTIAEAEKVLARLHEPLDLLLTDVAMPGGLGTDLAARVRKAHPRVRIVYMSSYTRAHLASHGIDLGVDALLEKPFMPGELVRRVRGYLP